MKKVWDKYKYWAIGTIIIFWMLIFDSNNFIELFQLRREINELNDKKEYYTQEIAIAKKTQLELFSNSRNLEQFAREKYYMKKSNEDLFIFREKKD